MNTSAKSLLQQIARIRHMERGKLCSLPGRPYFNHQTWENGRNLVRYIPRSQAQSLRRAIAGYRRFLQLTDLYATRIIEQSRQQRIKDQNIQKMPKPKQF